MRSLTQVACINSCINPSISHFLAGTYTHYIDEASPMYTFYTKDRIVRGMITLEVTGYDHVLDEELHQMWMFSLPDDAAPCSRFANTVLKSTCR